MTDLFPIVKKLIEQIKEETEEKARYMKWAFSMQKLLGSTAPPLASFKKQVTTDEEVLERIKDLST